jgi:adenine-specific DNA methylase
LRETLGYNKNHKDRHKDDFYATPPEEVLNILQHEELIGKVLEPSCGMGHMVKGIRKDDRYKELEIIATDLVDRGFGEGNLDYLSDTYPYTKDIGTIIMNPPFKLIEEFVNKSLKIA